MRRLLAFVALEARLQRRSLRFVVLAAGYLLLSLVPPTVLSLGARPEDGLLGPATWAANAYLLQPLLVTALSGLPAADALTRERDEGSLVVVALTELPDAAYALGRWLALQALVLPLTLVGPGIALLLSWTSTGRFNPEPFVWPWLLHVAPLALSVSGLMLGVGALAGGLIPGTVLVILVTSGVLWLGNDLLALVGRRLSGPWPWVLGEAPADAFLATELGERRGVVGGLMGRLGGLLAVRRPATEGPFDPAAALELLAANAAIPLGACAVGLALATRYVRRCRPDVRPWPIPDRHPLRTYLKLLNALRVGAHPDPRPGIVERGATWLGLVLLVFAVGTWWQRDARFRALAEQRWSVENAEGPAPTPRHLIPSSWDLAGDLHADGSLSLRVTARLRHGGAGEPVGRAAFELHPDLRVEAVRADRDVAFERAWDRLEVSWSPPLGEGDEFAVRFVLAGRPRELRMEGMQEVGDEHWKGSFVRSWARARSARISSRIVDVSRWRSTRAASHRRVLLASSALVPVVRHDAWSLDRRGRVLADMRPVTTDVTIDLRAPASWLLASSCGRASELVDGEQLLQGSCRVALTDLVVAGGRLERVRAADGPSASAADGAVIACLPSHVGAASLHRPAFEQAERLSRRAWPALAAGGALVVVEVPPRWHPSAWTGMGWRWWRAERRESFHGRLVLLPERFFAGGQALDPSRLARGRVASEMESLRRLSVDESLFLRTFFEAYAVAEFGRSPPSAVVETASNWYPRAAAAVTGPDQPDVDGARWMADTYLRRRVLPRLADLRRRVGEAALREALHDFLSVDGDRPATSAELFELLEARSGVSLDAFHADYIVGAAMPALTLEEVAFREVDETWTVSGRVTNSATGRALVPLLLETDGAPVQILLEVGSAGSSSFHLESPDRPRHVSLDPRRRCFRWRPKGGLGVTEQVVHAEGT